MSFIKNLFGKSKKPGALFSEGDIFYTVHKNQYHLYKLLKIEEESDTFHVLGYKPLDALPVPDSINELEISIFHFPVDKNSFKDGKLLTKSDITPGDLVGYEEYLRHTEQVNELFQKADRYFQEAYRLTDDNKHEEAIEKYSEAIKLVPHYFEAIDNRAFCKMDLGLWNEAIEDFRQSLMVKPNSFLAEFSICECYYRLGDYIKAKEQFKKAEAIDPSNDALKILRKKLQDHNLN